ncbi:FBox-LRR protein [Pelomyxa schiedti]|nr:FBox-LRR protein [Pelomyxa schiedti]
MTTQGSGVGANLVSGGDSVGSYRSFLSLAGAAQNNFMSRFWTSTSGSKTIDESPQVLNEVFQHSGESINLKGLSYGEEGAKAFATVIAGKLDLTTLQLGGGLFPIEIVRTISSALCCSNSLTDLSFTDGNIGFDGAKVLSTVITTKKILRKFNIYGNNIGPEGSVVYAYILQTNSCLKTINLARNNIGPDGMKPFIDALRVNTTLTELDLEGNNIGDRGATYLCTGLKANNTITSLNLSKNNIGNDGSLVLANVLQHNTSITSLLLGENKLGPIGARNITTTLEQNATLTSLHLEDNNIGPEGGKAISDCLKSNDELLELVIDKNNIGIGIQHISEALIMNCTLTSLSCACNAIGPDVAMGLIFALKLNSTLTFLDVQGNELGVEARNFLTETLRSGNSTLTALSIESNQCDPTVSALLAANEAFSRSIAAEFTVPEETLCQKEGADCRSLFSEALWRCVLAADVPSVIALLNLYTHHIAHWGLTSEQCVNRTPKRVVTIIDSSATSYSLLWHACEHSTTCIHTSCALVRALLVKGGVDISHFDTHAAGELVLMLSKLSTSHQHFCKSVGDPHGCGAGAPFDLEWTAVRIWARAGNWAAVSEALSSHRGPSIYNRQVANLSHLHLSTLPKAIAEKLVCQGWMTIDLSGNHLNSLPYSLHLTRNLHVEGNPLSEIPANYRSGDYPTRSLQHWLRFGGPPSEWVHRKLVIVGEENVGKTTLLQCLSKGKPIKSKRSVATNGISIHSPFQMNKNSALKWVAWDFGGHEVLYPSHQFFLGSNSVFVVVVNAATLVTPKTSELPLSYKRVQYWLNQIHASQRQIVGVGGVGGITGGSNISFTPSEGFGGGSSTKIVLVGTHADVVGVDTAAESLLSVFDNDNTPREALRCVFVLSSSTGEGRCVRKGGNHGVVHTNESTSSSSNAIQLLCKYIEELASEKVYVPDRWVILHDRLAGGSSGSSSASPPKGAATGTAEQEPIMQWKHFASVASLCGVSSDEDLLWCSNFLSDAGTIIHFRKTVTATVLEEAVASDVVSVTSNDHGGLVLQSNPSDAPIDLEDIVVLNPLWLSRVMKSVITIGNNNSWIKLGFLQSSNVPHLFAEFPKPTHHALLQLLQQFEIAQEMHDSSFLFPCLLPPTPTPPPTSPWWVVPASSSDPSHTTDAERGMFMGRVFRLQFIPVGFFSRLMSRILSVNSVLPGLLWKGGITVLHRTPRQQSQLPSVALVTCDDSQFVYIHVYSTMSPSKEITTTASSESSISEADPSALPHSTPPSYSRYDINSGGSIFLGLIVSVVTAFVKNQYPILFQDISQHCACPYCLTKTYLGETHSAESAPVGAFSPTPSSAHHFHLRECVDLVRRGETTLLCPTQHSGSQQVPVSLLAPDIVLLPLIDPSELQVFSSQETSTEKVKNPQPSTQAFCQTGAYGKVFKGLLRGNQVVAVKESLSERLPSFVDLALECEVMCRVPPHDNLVHFWGVCLQPRLRVIMEFIFPAYCPRLESVLGGVGIVGSSALSSPDLMKLITVVANACTKLNPETATAGKPGASNSVGIAGVKIEDECTLIKYRETLEYVIPVHLRKKILLDIAQGLNHLHTQSPSIVHGDLHLGNILICSLDPTGEGPWAKITDFGLAQYLYGGAAVDRRQRLPVNVFAPEVIRGSKIDTKADVWSYGMCVRHFIDPFTPVFNPSEIGTDDLEAREAVGSGRAVPHPPPHSPSGWTCPPWASTLMTWCWAPVSKTRPTCAQMISYLQSGYTPFKFTLNKPCYSTHFVTPESQQQPGIVPLPPTPGLTSASSAPSIPEGYQAHPRCHVVACVGTRFWCGFVDGTILVFEHCTESAQPNSDCTTPKAVQPPATGTPSVEPLQCHNTSVVWQWTAHWGRDPGVTSIIYVKHALVAISASMSGQIKVWHSQTFSLVCQVTQQSALPLPPLTAPQIPTAPPNPIVSHTPPPPPPSTLSSILSTTASLFSLTSSSSSSQPATSSTSQRRAPGVGCLAICGEVGGTGSAQQLWTGDVRGNVCVWDCIDSGVGFSICYHTTFSVSNKVEIAYTTLPTQSTSSSHSAFRNALPTDGTQPHTYSPSLLPSPVEATNTDSSTSDAPLATASLPPPPTLLPSGEVISMASLYNTMLVICKRGAVIAFDTNSLTPLALYTHTSLDLSKQSLSCLIVAACHNMHHPQQTERKQPTGKMISLCEHRLPSSQSQAPTPTQETTGPNAASPATPLSVWIGTKCGTVAGWRVTHQPGDVPPYTLTPTCSFKAGDEMVSDLSCACVSSPSHNPLPATSTSTTTTTTTTSSPRRSGSSSSSTSTSTSASSSPASSVSSASSPSDHHYASTSSRIHRHVVVGALMSSGFSCWDAQLFTPVCSSGPIHKGFALRRVAIGPPGGVCHHPHATSVIVGADQLALSTIATMSDRNTLHVWCTEPQESTTKSFL